MLPLMYEIPYFYKITSYLIEIRELPDNVLNESNST